jgi:4-hydroxy-tetrahydrodipicolinate synthase
LSAEIQGHRKEETEEAGVSIEDISLRGVTTALVTPFHEDGSIDLDSFEKVVKHQIRSGVAALLPLGTTGETPTLSREECDQVIRRCVEIADGKVPVMVGTGSNSTQATIENTVRAKELGADIALVVTPYYNKPGQRGIVQHYREVAAASDLPILQYNIAGRCGVNVETETMIALADIPRVIGVKEASGNVHQIAEVIERIRNRREGFVVLSGDDSMTIHTMALGGDGVVSVVSNLVPELVCDLVSAGLRGDFEEVRRLHFETLPLFRAAFIETNPSPIKYLMKNTDLIRSDAVRLPLLAVSEESQKALDSVIAELAIS